MPSLKYSVENLEKAPKRYPSNVGKVPLTKQDPSQYDLGAYSGFVKQNSLLPGTMGDIPSPLGNRKVLRNTNPSSDSFFRAPDWSDEQKYNSKERVIGSSDERFLVTDTRERPFRSICQLKVRKSNATVMNGTGFFVGPGIVLTAGHNFYDRGNGSSVRSIEIVPARNGAHRPFGTIYATNLHIPENWKQKFNDAFDYALVVLEDSDVGDQTGWFGTMALYDSILNKASIAISGYPIGGGKQQYCSYGRIENYSDEILSYKVDTTNGQSGGPIYVRAGDQYIAVGLHTDGKNLNSGVRLRKSIIETIEDIQAAL